MRSFLSKVIEFAANVEEALGKPKSSTRECLKEPDTPFAEILRDIRAQAYSGNAEDTYAAYCFYGSPLAKRKM